MGLSSADVQSQIMSAEVCLSHISTVKGKYIEVTVKEKIFLMVKKVKKYNKFVDVALSQESQTSMFQAY